MGEGLYVKLRDVIESPLWQVFPVINVDKVADIPADYLGAMGVPITFLDKYNPEQFEILTRRGHLRLPDGRQPYQRIIIRNLRPQLPEIIDIAEMLNAMDISVDVKYDKDDTAGNIKLHEDNGP